MVTENKIDAETPVAVVVRDSSIPVENEIDISTRNLKYVHVKTQKEILKSINLRIKSKRLTVILGASGAGKTTLLNMLAGEKETSSITMNGNVVTTKQIKAVSGYVHQDDVILPTMTVNEALNMSATLRLPKTVSKEDKERRVTDTLQMLQLEKVRNSVIGSTLEKGISGGEKKRVSIGMELIFNPPVLYLDEPTSGLDTFTAFTVVKMLKELAASGRTIVCTLHQPSSEIFHLIDDLILLADGQVMYCGEANHCLDYFGRFGYSCPTFTNPGDFIFMNVFNNISIEDSVKRRKVAEETRGTLLKHWKESDESKALDEYLKNEAKAKDTISSTRYRAPFLTQFLYLSRRSFLNAIRNKMVVKAKLAQSLIIALLVGAIFSNVSDRKGASKFGDRAGALFFLTANLVMSGIFTTQTVFAGEKEVFKREYENGYYSLPSFFLSKNFVELPFGILIPIIFMSIVYWIIGFQAVAGKFLDTLPVWIQWVKYLSPMKYGFVALAKNEFSGLEFCAEDDFVCRASIPLCRPGDLECVPNGDKALEVALGLTNEGSIEVNLGVLFGMYLGFLLLSYGFLWRSIVFGKRNGS